MLARSIVFLAAVSLLTGCETEQSVASEPSGFEGDWIQLFNGEDLTGWQIKFTGYELGYNFNNTFRVDNGYLTANFDEWDGFGGEFGHIFYDEPFSHYRLRAEYRFVGEQVEGGPGWAFRNNGVMLHSQSAESMELDQEFPTSLELQLLGGDGETERPTANLCTPGTHIVIDGSLVTDHCINSASPTFHGDQWVTVEALVLGDSLIQHIVDGEVVLEYTDPRLMEGALHDYTDNRVGRGHIALQAETHSTQFRRVEVLNLKGCTDPSATNYRSYYVQPDSESCQF